VRTLTILPVPGREGATPAASLGWFPLVGLLLGGIVLLVAHSLDAIPLPLPSGGIAVLLLTVAALLTRGFHLDGLADWADGWWGGYDRERILAIMKDSHIGTFGVVALILTILGKWTCYAHLLRSGGQEWIAVSFVLARMGVVDLAVAHPYARTESGTASRFVQEARSRHWLLAAALTVAILFLWPGLPLHHAAMGMLTSLLVARLFGLRCRKRIGGVTGDILGAGSELIELVTLALGVLLRASGTLS
jgi:adenosylcobinamide-GDP ribazoletransferase